MIPAAFAYHRAGSAAEAVELLAEHGGEARVLAGGQSLLPLLKLRLTDPAVLIDLGGAAELRRIETVPGGVRIGAMATHNAVGRSPLLAPHGAVRDCWFDLADPLVRNRGTFGGSLAHADPAGDWPAVALALDARIHVTGPHGGREIPADGFFLSVFTTALAQDEVLTHVDLPAPRDGTCSAYLKSAHPASGYAVAGVAVSLRMDGAVCSGARIAVTGVSGVPYRARTAEQLLEGGEPGGERLREVGEAVVADAGSVLGDDYAPETYRRHLASVVTNRAIGRALRNR